MAAELSLANALIAGLRTLHGSGADAVLVSCVSEAGEVGPSQCFEGGAGADPMTAAFEFVVFEGARRAIVAIHTLRLRWSRPNAVALAQGMAVEAEGLGIDLLMVGVSDPQRAHILVRDEAGRHWAGLP